MERVGVAKCKTHTHAQMMTFNGEREIRINLSIFLAFFGENLIYF